ncbi:50S ribosomal protein L7/L12 [Allocoleopsis sp.]|uniref:50S ribosomal protein L7/L12 n=1 Tax=Allocoleopsis sp. TaxID=3088169 RepID=UPI002FD4639C
MSVKTMEILEQLKSLTILETTELVKQIEETFGVDASTTRFISGIPIQPEIVVGDEPLETEFDVVLEEVPADKKIAILKVVRTLTGLALKEAKDFVESAPKVVKEAIALDAAEDIKQQLEAAGAKVSLN